MLRLLKNSTARMLFAGLALILMLPLMFLLRTFAAGWYIDINPDPTKEFYTESGKIELGEIVSVNQAGIYKSIYGFVRLADESTDCVPYFTLTSLESVATLPGDAVVNINSTTGEYSITSDTGIDLSASDEVIKSGYEISADAPTGISCKVQYATGYEVEIAGVMEDRYSDGYFADVQVTRNPNDDLAFATAGPIGKVYGDDNFSNLIQSGTTHGAPISYASNNEDVAIVNSTTGEVQIIGAGDATIIATAAQYYQYAEGNASYTLNVNPKEISISGANVPDKTYDGTTDSEVGVVTLNEAGLVQGVDYTATAVLDNANAGSDRTATVTVTLIGDAANNYVLTSNTIDVDNVTISPYTITSDDIALEYYLTRYDGTEKEPGVTVKIGSFVVNSGEYTVDYEDNVDVGMAAVIVTAKDNMNIASSASKNFEIVDKDVLSITGISSPQTLIYTGNPVVLEGNLTVGDNTDGITVDDLTIIWYIYTDTSWNVTTQPTDAGIYKVRYTYDGVNYVGELEVNFEIEQAVSPNPAEMTDELTIEAGKRLSEIEGTRTNGFYWDDEDEIVLEGENTYLAHYTYNGDTANYTTLHIRVSVYGSYTPEPVPTPDDDGGETAKVPDTGRFTSASNGMNNTFSIVGIVIASCIFAFVVISLIIDRITAKNKIDFTKK